MRYNDIDWGYHTVFSYVMDPIQRRHKGISEIIIATGTQDLVLKNPDNFLAILKQIPFLDAHSASLHDIYGERVQDINWLLMTTDHQVAIKETEKFLAQHSAPAIEWNAEYTHATESYMSEIFVHVKAVWESTEEPQKDFTVDNYFLADIELYNQIKDRYDRNHQS